jgi:glycerol 2-dehydrogenase (NADP+)
VIKDLAVKYNVTPTQIILGWGLARGVSLATRSTKELHRKHTLNVCPTAGSSLFPVVLKRSPQLPDLDPEDVKKITALDRRQFAYLQLDERGTAFGWTLEQYGWEHLKPSGVGGASKSR